MMRNLKPEKKTGLPVEVGVAAGKPADIFLHCSLQNLGSV